MIKQQGFRAKFKSRQQGAVAIIVAISLVVLIGMLGLVVDLGHLYVTKTELQNAADAAALSGAKQLDRTAEGICCGDGTGGTKRSAVFSAIEAAGKNKYDLRSKVVNITAANNIVFSSSPDGPWVNASDAQLSPANKTFIKVDTNPGTGIQSLNTWFIHVLPGAASSMRTFGMAVAGRYVVNVAPIGVCAIDPVNPTRNNNNELLEYGFRRGMGYNILAINDAKKGLAGLSQVPLWINPIDVPPNACAPSNSSDATLRPFICAGESSSIVDGGSVYINTGVQTSQERFLNSRFDNPQSFGNNRCDATSTPPDSNVKQYRFDTAVAGGGPRDWTQPGLNDQPARQTVALNPATPGVPFNYPNVPLATENLGVLWSFTRAVRYDGSASGNVGTPFGINDWGPADVASGGANLYNLDADTTTNGYPTTAGSGFPVGTQPAPYNQPSGNKYHRAPTNFPPGLSGRRVINVAIINCDAAAGGSGSCQTLPVRAIARFFMTVEADFSSSIKSFDAEFAGVVNTGQIPRDVRLYR